MKKNSLVILSVIFIGAIAIIFYLIFSRTDGYDKPEEVLESYYAKVEQSGANSLQKFVNNYENLQAEDKEMLDTYVKDFQSFIIKHKGIKSIDNISLNFKEPQNEEVVISFTILYNDDYKEEMNQRLIKVNDKWKVIP